jgi:hypothetical protein
VRDRRGTNIPGILGTSPTGFQGAWQPWWGGGGGMAIYLYSQKSIKFF